MQPRSWALVLLFAISTNAATQTSPASQPVSLDPILQKVLARYQTLTSYSATGEAVSIMDMSAVDLPHTPGMTPERQEELKNLTSQKEPEQSTYTFSIKLGRPACYLVEWAEKTAALEFRGVAALHFAGIA